MLHSRCALERIRNGWPTQNITFEHLRCPLCGEDGREPTARGSMQAAVMSHPSLARALAPALALRETVMRRARRRLALDANGPPRQIPGGRRLRGPAGRVRALALELLPLRDVRDAVLRRRPRRHRGGVERATRRDRCPPLARRRTGSCAARAR